MLFIVVCPYCQCWFGGKAAENELKYHLIHFCDRVPLDVREKLKAEDVHSLFTVEYLLREAFGWQM